MEKSTHFPVPELPLFSRDNGIYKYKKKKKSQFIDTYATTEAEDINKGRKYNANEYRENNTSSFSELITQIQ